MTKPRSAWQHSTESPEARGYGRAWRRLREVILARDAGLCQCPDCKRLGRLKPATQVDHVIPKAQGGTDDLGNLRAINADCHKRVTLLQQGKQPRTAIGLDGWPVE